MNTKNNRNSRISIRLNSDEKAKLELHSSLAGLTPSAYIRHILLKAKTPTSKYDKTMIIQISKIGNNLNQIARHLNHNHAIDGIVLKQIIEINESLKRISGDVG